VTFSDPYLEQPVVSASISLDKSDNPAVDTATAGDIFLNNIQYVITNKSTTGFTILLNKPAIDDTTFSWIALAVTNPKTFGTPSGYTLPAASSSAPSEVTPPPSDSTASSTASTTSDSDTTATTTATSTQDTTTATTTNETSSVASSTLTTITITPATASLNVGGQTANLSATTLDQNGQPITTALTWTSDNTAVATVDNNGTVTPLSAGTANITAESGSVTSNLAAISVEDATDATSTTTP
jgi:hypothetical protein